MMMLCSPRDGIGFPYALSSRSRQMEAEARDDSAATNAHQIMESTDEASDDRATRNGRTLIMMEGDEEGGEAAIETAVSSCTEIHVLPLSPHPKSNDNDSLELTQDNVEVIKPNHRALFTRLGGGRKYINMMFGSRKDVTKDRMKTIKAEMDTILEAMKTTKAEMDTILEAKIASDNVQQMKESVDVDLITSDSSEILSPHEEGGEAAIESAISSCTEIHVLPLSPHPKSNDNDSLELTQDSVEVIKPNHRALFTRLGGGRKYINMMFGSRKDVTKDRMKTIKAEMDTILEAMKTTKAEMDTILEAKIASDNVQQMKESVDVDLITSDSSEILSPHTNATVVTQKSGEKSTIEGPTNTIQEGPSIAQKMEIPTVLCVLEDVYKGTADLLLDVYDDIFPMLPLNANGEFSFCTSIGVVGRGGSKERPQHDCLEKSISLDHTAQHGLLTGIQYNSLGTEIGRDTRNLYNPMRRDSEVGDSVDSVASSYSYRPEPAYRFQMNSYQHAEGEPYRQYPGVPSQSSSGLIPPSISSLTATAQLGKIYPPPNPVHNEIFATEDIATFTAKCQRGTTSSAASVMISDTSSQDNIDERQDRYAIIEEEEDERDLTPSVSPTRITIFNQFTDRYHVSDNTTMARQDHQGKHVLCADSTRTTWNNHIMTTQEQYLPAPRVLTSDNSTYNNLHHMQHQVHQISHQHQQSESKQLASFAC